MGKIMLSVGRRIRHDPDLPTFLKVPAPPKRDIEAIFREWNKPANIERLKPPHTISYDDLIGVICVAFALGFALGYLLGFHGNG